MPSIVVGFQFFIHSCKLQQNFMSIRYLEQHVRNILELNVPSLQTRMGGFESKDRTCGSTAVTADSSWGSNPNIQPSKSTTCPSPPQSKSSFSCWQFLYLFNLPQNFSSGQMNHRIWSYQNVVINNHKVVTELHTPYPYHVLSH